MHKHIIATFLVATCFTQTGCGIISHFVQKKKSDDAAAADAADKKALEETIAKKDLSKLKTECKGTAENPSKRDWCQGYQKVFVENAGDRPDSPRPWAAKPGRLAHGTRRSV